MLWNKLDRRAGKHILINLLIGYHYINKELILEAFYFMNLNLVIAISKSSVVGDTSLIRFRSSEGDVGRFQVLLDRFDLSS